MVTDLPPRNAPSLQPPVVSTQQWVDVGFVHRTVDPDRVAALLPPGTEPDLFEGRTFVGLVLFRMHRAGAGRGPAWPWFGTFCETNVRLYSRDSEGRQGVVFLSLDCERLGFVLGARGGYRLPYCWSSMAAVADGRHRRWTCRRRWPEPGPRSVVELDVGGVVEPTDLDVFLTARWGAHSTWHGRTIWTPNEHEPWAMHEAHLSRCEDELVAAAGVTGLGAPEAADVPVRWSPGVRARFGRPQRLA